MAFRNFIGGEWVASASGATFETRNPANIDEVVGVYQKSDAADTRQAIEAAQKAQPAWAAIQAPKRGEILHRAAGGYTDEAIAWRNWLLRLFGATVHRVAPEESAPSGSPARSPARRSPAVASP